MRSVKVLEMLNEGKIDELKTKLQDEIYADSLKSKPNAKKRYAAMKKYFSYTNNARECCQKPCEIEFEGKPYISFTNSWSLVLTTEDIGEIELFDKENLNYPDVTRLLSFEGIKRKVDFNKIFAEAKSRGYKLTKKEVGPGFEYLMLYDGTYYKIGLLEATYGIIDDGKEAMVYHPDGKRKPLTIQTSIGICMIMPVFIKDEDEDDIEPERIIEVEL